MSVLNRRRSARRHPSLRAGTLQTIADTVYDDVAAGLTDAMVEPIWSSYETSAGVFNSAYIDPFVAEVNELIAAGVRVTLGIGIHGTPQWVLNMGVGFVDEVGGTDPGPDWIFDQRIRDRISSFLARVDADFDFSRIAGLRVFTSEGEMMYPDTTTSGSGFVAYGASPQNGPNLATGQSPNPFPGWRPGETSITTTQVGQWYDWYVGALAQYTDWFRSQCDALGFTGFYQPVCAGVGVRTNDATSAINARLSGASNPVKRGVAYDRFLKMLPRKDRIMMYCSSVGELNSDTTPGTPADRLVALTDSATNGSWGAGRWQSRLAMEYGVRMGGENPGAGLPPDSSYTDLTSSGMMAHAFAQARGGNFDVLYWAHDFNLRNGDLPFSAFSDRIVAGKPPPPTGRVGFRSAGSASTGNTPTATVRRPGGLIVGDLMICAQVTDQDGAPASMTAPSGWTLLGTGGGPQNTAISVKIWQKVAVSGDVSATGFAFPDGTNAHCSAGIIVLAAGTFTPGQTITPTFTNQTTASAAHVAPSVTGVVNGLLVTIHCSNAQGTKRTYTAPPEMTERVDTALISGGWTALAMFTQSLGASGATGTRTATCSGSTPYVTASLVIAP